MDDLLSKGEDHFSREEFAEAKACFAALLEKEAGSKEAWNNLGVIACQEGDWPGAVRSFTRALGVDPFYREAFFNLHRVAKGTGRLGEMAPFAEGFCRRYPEDEGMATLMQEIRSARGKTGAGGARCPGGSRSGAARKDRGGGGRPEGAPGDHGNRQPDEYLRIGPQVPGGRREECPATTRTTWATTRTLS